MATERSSSLIKTLKYRFPSCLFGLFTTNVIIQGIVNENKIVLNQNETLDDIVYSETTNQYKGKVRTLLKNNGIIAVASQELTQEV